MGGQELAEGLGLLELGLRGVEVWAGRGFGGQLLYVLPEQDLVGVMNAWNVFGGDRRIGDAFLDALIDSVATD